MRRGCNSHIFEIAPIVRKKFTKRLIMDFFKKIIKLLFITLLIGISTKLKSQTLDYDFSKFKKLVEETMLKNDIPGMQVAIISKDSILWKSNFGYADLKKLSPVSDSTMFRVGSISKIFVSISTLILKERELISLDDKLSEIAPEIEFKNKWENTNPIRIVNLLEHTAGFDDYHAIEFSTNADGWTTLQGLQFHPNPRVSKWKPGRFMSYTNTATACAAYAVEKVSNETYEEFVNDNIFQPLGMRKSSFFLTDYIAENLAKGYNSTDSNDVNYWHILNRASGALNSNVSELSHVVQMLLNRGSFDNQEFLNPSSINRIEHVETTLAAKAGFNLGYGLCMNSEIRQGYTKFFHHGTINGYISSLQYFPELGVGFIILTNTSREEGLRNFLNEFQSLLIPDSIKKSVLDTTLTIKLSKDVTGWYEKNTARVALVSFTYQFFNFMKIGKENNQYYYKRLFFGQWDLIPYSENSLISVNSKSYVPFIFVDDENGNEYLQLPLHELNYKKINGFVVWGKISLLILGVLIVFSSIIEIFILLFIRLVKRRKPKMTFSRILPLTAILIGILWMFFYINYFSFYTMGKIGFESVGFFILSILFAVISISAFLVNLLKIKYEMNKFVRVHSFIVSSFCLFVTIYLYYNDFIGLIGWLY
jgi:CubicO group peptidase (beta-lactamase class C family)